jgi:hypothetical protein
MPVTLANPFAGVVSAFVEWKKPPLSIRDTIGGRPRIDTERGIEGVYEVAYIIFLRGAGCYYSGLKKYLRGEFKEWAGVTPENQNFLHMVAVVLAKFCETEEPGKSQKANRLVERQDWTACIPEALPHNPHQDVRLHWEGFHMDEIHKHCLEYTKYMRERDMGLRMVDRERPGVAIISVEQDSWPLQVSIAALCSPGFREKLSYIPYARRSTECANGIDMAIAKWSRVREEGETLDLGLPVSQVKRALRADGTVVGSAGDNPAEMYFAIRRKVGEELGLEPESDECGYIMGDVKRESQTGEWVESERRALSIQCEHSLAAGLTEQVIVEEGTGLEQHINYRWLRCDPAIKVERTGGSSSKVEIQRDLAPHWVGEHAEWQEDHENPMYRLRAAILQNSRSGGYALAQEVSEDRWDVHISNSKAGGTFEQVRGFIDGGGPSPWGAAVVIYENNANYEQEEIEADVDGT